ncbi:hypothetical protein LTR36_009933 [Oleoguttula mirabilis]|uniref:Autophagy-related protein 14 n=1 Tax=Oleoguttula mirabilis TaxID=1507867 RepID=A0AAV9J5E5_9PEZI|nr:hypothetical protein LTR36_009933 [Oleoguttula mirabilis]
MASKPARPPAQPDASVRRDRPWLLPTNRKLRNFVSISLRNLSLAAPSLARSRGKTIDDDAVPNTLKSPAKLVALREQKALGQSRSSSDLRSGLGKVAEDAVEDGDGEGDLSAHANARPTTPKERVDGAPRTPQRPSMARMRRRSTLEWANATPQRRQEKLENVTAERMADVFFSVHVNGVEEPVYVSETVAQTMNPTFRHVDWAACGPGTTRCDRLTLRFWVKSSKLGGWRQLLELSLSLQSLHYLGKSLDQFHHALPQNAVIFYLTDGVYTSFASLSDYAPPPSAPPPTRATSTRILPTASFDALLRLAKLDDSIQDALQTRNKIAADLEALLEANHEALTERDQVAEAEDRQKTIDYAKKTVDKQLDKARRQQEEKRQLLLTRRELMAKDVSDRATQRDDMEKARPELPNLRDEHEVKKKAIQNQRRRACEDLQRCYTIQPVAGKSLAFTIRDLHLPNSDDLDAEPPHVVAAALGHVAHVALMLSFYLGQPLPYPVTPRSSNSTIEDPISLLKTTASTTQSHKDERALRTYPLFSKGAPRFRFEYAVFLLNKDLQVLVESACNVHGGVLDIRHTLPNLKYLLYVATAGEGELPARKAGGIRGLLRTQAGGTPELRRLGSGDSAGSAVSGLLWLANGNGEGKGKAGGAVDSLKRHVGG